MRRRVLTVILFVAAFVALDQVVGLTLEKLYFRTRTGEGGGLINEALTKNPDILLLGSSRMKHHLDPGVLEEELSMSAYNAGVNGQEFFYAAMLLDVRKTECKRPKIIILNVDRNSLADLPAEIPKARVFSYYVDRSALVRKILAEQSPLDRVKYWSRSFRANEKVFPIFKNVLARPKADGNGFEALPGTIKVAHPDLKDVLPFSEFKKEIFREIVNSCRQSGTKLILLNSPEYISDPRQTELQAVWRGRMRTFLAEFPDVDFLEINGFTYPKVFSDRNLYKDSAHLNGTGAEIFSRMVAKAVRERIEKR
jgi:hypothetical protein